MTTAASINVADEDLQNIVEAHAVLWNHTLSYIKSMCLKCAVQLHIPDAIHRHGRPATIFQSHITISGEESFDLAPVSRLLTTTAPLGLSSSPIVLMLLDHHIVDPCHNLYRWFHRPDVATTPFEMAHGKSFWDLAGARPEFNDLFNKGMASDSVFVTNVLKHVGGEVFHGFGSLVDVGGGTGSTAAALVEAFPGLKCTVFDLPHVVNTAPKMVGIQFVGGDMFVEVPNADVALLKWILHDWSDEDCVKILQRCKKAIPHKEKGGKVIIIDMVVGMGMDTQTSLETQFLFDLEMMILVNGKERDQNEWRELFVAAGFSSYKITSSIGLRSIIEVYP